MKIRNKITIMYSQLIFMVLLASFVFVYVITSNNIESRFYDKLWERAMITCQIHFEKDEMTDNAYRSLQERYKFVLNNETHMVLPAGDKPAMDSVKMAISGERKIRSLVEGGKTVESRKGDIQSIGVFYPDNEGNFIVIVSAEDRAGTESRRGLFNLLAIILAAGTVIVYLVGLLYAKRILSPIVVMINNVKRITANNLKRSLREERGNDELSELSRTFNNMILRLRNSFEMQNSFIRNASHELKNPLTAILGETEIALSKPRTGDEYVATLETILVESERLDSMIKDLLMLAQTDFDFSRIPKKSVNLRELIEEVVKGLPNATVNIISDEEKECVTTGVASLLKIAFLNIIGNASKFSSGKPVDVRIGRKVGKILIEVIDKGVGIPQGEIKNIMQPFYRAENTSSFKGTGIGLALSSRIISLHSGKLNITSKAGEGTVVSVIVDDK